MLWDCQPIAMTGHRWVIFSIVYLSARCLLRCLIARGRREASKDAGLLVLRHENAVPRRRINRVATSRATSYGQGPLFRPIPRHRW